MISQIPSQPIVSLAFWAGMTVIALTLLLMAAILVVRAVQMYRERRHRRVVDRWRPMIIESLEGRVEVPELPEGHTVPVLLTWNYLRQSLRGEAEERLNKMARRAAFPERARDLLGARSVRKRMLGIETLGLLGDRRAYDRLAELVGTRNTYVSMAAARAVLRIDPRRAMPRVVEAMGRRSDWVPNTVMAMLREVGPDLASEHLPYAVLNADEEFKPLMLLYLKAAHGSSVLPVVKQLLADQRDEQIITTCIHLLGDSADPRALPVIRRYLRHSDWKIRLHGCVALGRLGTDHDVDLLVGRLADTEYWVRYRAAQALANLPFMTDTRLEEIRDGVDDRYARDILTQVIAERGDAEEAATVASGGGAA